jgi:hypothetical protein
LCVDIDIHDCSHILILAGEEDNTKHNQAVRHNNIKAGKKRGKQKKKRIGQSIHW